MTKNGLWAVWRCKVTKPDNPEMPFKRTTRPISPLEKKKTVLGKGKKKKGLKNDCRRSRE